jgi:hypothetical protein
MVLSAMLTAFGGGIGGHLRAAYEAKLNAQNDSERLAAEITIAQLEERQKGLAAGGMIAAWVQASFALVFLVYTAKLVIWDKVLGWGVTDPLSPELHYIQMIVLSFYFLTASIRKT